MPSREMGFTIKKPPEATLTVTVYLGRGLRFRIWLALGLIRLASWVMGWNVEVDEVTDGLV